MFFDVSYLILWNKETGVLVDSGLCLLDLLERGRVFYFRVKLWFVGHIGDFFFIRNSSKFLRDIFYQPFFFSIYNPVTKIMEAGAISIDRAILVAE